MIRKPAQKALLIYSLKSGCWSQTPTRRERLPCVLRTKRCCGNGNGSKSGSTENREFLRMRDRVDSSLKLWLSRGKQKDDLLEPGLPLGRR